MEYHYEEIFLIGYGEVDEHNRMRISSLLNFLQDVATMHSKSIGYGTTECMNRKIGWFLISWQIKMYSYPQGEQGPGASYHHKRGAWRYSGDQRP